MKLKVASALLLLICFSLLVIPSGVIPVFARGEAEASEAPVPSAKLTAAPTDPPSGEPSPSPAPEVTETPAPTEMPAETEDPLRLISTTITADELLDNHTYYDMDAEALLAEGVSMPLPADGYQVLILHTHATEAYMPETPGQYEETDSFRTTDPEYSVIRVGEELAAALENYGLNVLHDTSLYDYPSYNGSYERSGTAAAEYLEAYPGIRLVIDLHRDALYDEEVMYKTVADMDGAEAAQLMFVMGSDVNLDHPAWQDNLRLALTLQQTVDERYPTLMRSTVLCDYRYNQQLCPGYLLLEVGTSGNTLSEAITGAKLFAEAVGPVLASWIDE